MNTQRIIVVGGGAAGMMAAGQAGLSGAQVLLLEKKECLGRKITISGKGRCNITNAANVEDFIIKYPGNGRFLQGILREFDNVKLREFLARYGVETKVERGGRVFPVSDEAEAVVQALEQFLTEAKVEIKPGKTVESLLLQDDQITGVTVSGEGVYAAQAVIVCTGGASYPGTGSSGDGYRFARALGHRVIPPRPALIPLRTAEAWVQEVQGLSLRNVEVALWIEGKKKAVEFGEMLFTHFGVSGPVILTLSRMAGDAVREDKPVRLTLNLKPALSEEQLDLRVQRDFHELSNKQFKNSLAALLPKSLIPVMINLSGIEPERSVHQITREERKRLVSLLRELPLTVTGTLPLAAAIVTAGGVDVKEINPKNMASKKITGLYWAGEVIDVDGVTGGYNLQAAFAMGYRAGRAAAAYLQSLESKPSVLWHI
ncbi:BaiN/RdsA family NAD(P)/FAD-dependent oxidoreductase [Paradesulfitobacterium ferrireducens]|uniref:NAD(P)/FAD-dependent oxidoreductase n=1 Tax=Paradesulfitobacterium ferrireducens TaxID=2816476 RepID=UPI001A8D43C3|nr:NAD(P)/FAD-dependent oxidoreductase [Paradesulfitobacterium ferrireducens]